MNLGMNSYITLGRTGLRVSPLCLGTMTFGTEWGWGTEEDRLPAPSSTVTSTPAATSSTPPTATSWARASRCCGKFINERELRDQIVLATKFTFNAARAIRTPAATAARTSTARSKASLRRLKTDFIDLYWLHAWDTVTPVEEVVSTLNDLVRAGKIRHYGFSDTPAWYVARAQTLAEQQGKDGIAALQLEYSLIERNIEREHIPVAQELGIADLPWSPLAGGFLTGKYKRDGDSGTGDGRLETPRQARFNKFTERNWRMLDAACRRVAQVGQVARAGRAQLGCHAARHHLHHHRRHQAGAAQRQSGVARFQDSGGSPQTLGRSHGTRASSSLCLFPAAHANHAQWRCQAAALDAGPGVAAALAWRAP